MVKPLRLLVIKSCSEAEMFKKICTWAKSILLVYIMCLERRGRKNQTKSLEWTLWGLDRTKAKELDRLVLFLVVSYTNVCGRKGGKQKERMNSCMGECVRGHALAPDCVSVLLGLLGWWKQVKMSLSAVFLVGLPPEQRESFQKPLNPSNLAHNTLKVACPNGESTGIQTLLPIATAPYSNAQIVDS